MFGVMEESAMKRSTVPSNPFTTRVAGGPDFCDRSDELAELEHLVRDGQSIVLSSPRRYGKTSLVLHLQEHLREQEFFTVYVDFFSVLSEQDFVTKLAKAVVAGIGRGASPDGFRSRLANLFRNFTVTFEARPEGIVVSAALAPGTSPSAGLDDVMESLFAYVEKNNRKACCVFDEFQEIATLAESKRIEGTLRSHIQMHKSISFVYVGSRRQLLMDMFGKNRPFYGSSRFMTLNSISRDDFVPYIVQRFTESGRTCSPDVASLIYDHVAGYPSYVQRLAALAWGMTETVCTKDIVEASWNALLDDATALFEATWTGLSPVQRRALTSIALEPTSQPSASQYLERYHVPASSMQKAIEALKMLDLVEYDKEWHLVDPVMMAWIRDARSTTI
jgi:hypothetical protein